ncbi:hypothetical protein Xoosp14_222 [Xanthomonas phage Xoo-sp14]|nr:hypothetical protein Xoosp14_222 [Xanthomonas phage Xoo-sp14]
MIAVAEGNLNHAATARFPGDFDFHCCVPVFICRAPYG